MPEIDKVPIDIEVGNLDIAIEKAKELKGLLEEVHSLIQSLKS